MNKRTMFMIGVVSAALLTSAGAVNATPTKNTIYVDGTKVNGAAYMINNNNYFKLRDVAAMVNSLKCLGMRRISGSISRPTRHTPLLAAKWRFLLAQ